MARTTKERLRIWALGVAIGLGAAGCGGGGGEGPVDNGGDDSQPVPVPADPTYRQQVVALAAGTYTLVCTGPGAKTSRVVRIGADGVVRTSGLASVDLGLRSSTLRLVQSYALHPMHNATAPGVTLDGSAAGASVQLAFTYQPQAAPGLSTLRLMKMTHVARGAATQCLSDPSIDGVNPPNLLNWDGEAFVQRVALISQRATCTPAVGAPYVAALDADALLRFAVEVPIAAGDDDGPGTDSLVYVGTYGDGASLSIEVRGRDNPLRAVTWRGVVCRF